MDCSVDQPNKLEPVPPAEVCVVPAMLNRIEVPPEMRELTVLQVSPPTGTP